MQAAAARFKLESPTVSTLNEASAAASTAILMTRMKVGSSDNGKPSFLSLATRRSAAAWRVSKVAVCGSLNNVAMCS